MNTCNAIPYFAHTCIEGNTGNTGNVSNVHKASNRLHTTCISHDFCMKKQPTFHLN